MEVDISSGVEMRRYPLKKRDLAYLRESMSAHFVNVEQKPPFCVRKSPRALCSDTFY